MDFDRLPAQVQVVLRKLAQAVGAREPAIRAHVEMVRSGNPHLTNDQLAQALIRSTRRRVAATGALSGAAAIAPGLGTVLAVGTITSQVFYALEQEVELVLGIAIIYTDLVRPGGWPQVGAVVAIIGVIDSLFVPRLVKKAWDQRDAAAAERARHGRTDASNE